MTISSSLNAGVSGLTANATSLAAISDNIANGSTLGYKTVTTSFQSMVVSQSGGTYAAGGVSVNNTRNIAAEGSLVTTNSSTDLAMSGRGFMPVAKMSEVDAGEEPTMLLSRTGSFTANDEGYLTTDSGLVLMGWPADADETFPTVARDTSEALEPIRFNVNSLSGSPTTEITLGVNLPATDAEGTAAATHTMSTEYFDNLGKSESLNISFTSSATNANEWTMVITDSATNSGGTTIAEYTLNFDDSRTDGGALDTVATVTGNAYNSTTGTVIVDVAGGPIEIQIGDATNGLTQLSDQFVAATIEKDGSEAASYAGVSVDASGIVSVEYDNGTSQIVYKIPVADMPNANGMKSLDNQTYLPSTDSGPFYLWDAGAGPTGTVEAFRQEESGTDVAGELTDMIKTQRSYSSLAKVIQTVDEMLQETTNIKR